MDWTRGPIIGRGSTATVSLATVVSSGEIIAVKSTQLSESILLQKEQRFLSKLSCPYIVKYLGSNVTREENKYVYNLCMEYASGGTLRDEIFRHGGRLDEQMIRLHTNQIVQGLNYMHVNGLVHCDVKSENVLMIDEGVVKIADLGCAKIAEKGGFATSEFSGTPVFMAPEVARREEQGFAADVWAVGCTVIEMATGTSPWPELSHPVAALYRIGFSGERPEIPGWLSEEGKDFLDKCLRRDPEERWTAQELLEHPFLSNLQVCDHEDVKILNANSPCTVLDHGIWDSLEVLENQESLKQEVSRSNSALKRIQDLIGSCSCSCSCSCTVSSWGVDEDWITVRSNGIEEARMEKEAVSDLIHEEELQDSVFNEDLMWEFYVENVTTTTSNVVSFSRDDFVLENLNFETNNDNSCVIQSQLKQIQCKYFSSFQSFWFMFAEKAHKIDWRLISLFR